MDRSEAATTLLRWQVEGERELAAAAGRSGAEDLVAAVERVHRSRPPCPPRPAGPPPPEWLRLREEREAEALRRRLQRMAPSLPPEVVADLDRRLAATLQPRSRLAAIRADLSHLSLREQRVSIHREFEAFFDAPGAAAPIALLLYSRDGRLLASEGSADRLDLHALSGIVRGGDSGTTWTLAHRAGFLVGHTGRRSALVVVLPNRPGAEVGTTLRASVASLEQRERLLNAPDAPSNHAKMSAYLRTVLLLLQRERRVTRRSRG